MSKSFYLTTPLYYVNGVPHVGHVYTTVLADAIARYKRMSDLEVCALTGTDEHGLKIQRAAADAGLSPRELSDKFAAAFYGAWDRLGLRFDATIRTTESRHADAVIELFRRIEANGFIYPGTYSGNYCVFDEAYVAEGETVCPDCGRPTESMSEDSYFFKLSEFEEKLLSFYEDNPDFVLPATRMNEVVSFVKGGLKDLSISRTSFTWGIPFPDDDKHIFYVWFDALIGYLSGIGFGDQTEGYSECWPADVQLIGKDILRFHAVYWPAFLMAAGLEPPRHILVNGWWTVDGEKMSKSKGNFITAEALADKLPTDYIRYFLIREIPVGNDGDFSFDALVGRVNADLANDIGNLANRTLKMIQAYFDGEIPDRGESGPSEIELQQFAKETIQLYRDNFDQLKINRALDTVWELISMANKYLVANEPWALARSRENRQRLGTVLYSAAETVRVISVLLGPIVPEGAAAALQQLGVAEALDRHSIAGLGWGELTPGTKIGQVEAVFPRLEPEETTVDASEAKTPQEPEKEAAKPSSPSITIDDFARVEIRVGRVISAERIPKSSKLLKLMVDIGTEQRQLVAGIGKAYDPDELAGRQVAVVTNLQPARLMGVESQGMIVAASDRGRPVLVGFDEEVPLGTRLK